MTDIAGQPARVSALLKERDYMAFWLTRVCGGFSYTIQSVTLGWLTYDIARRTHSIPESALYVGLIGFCSFIPMLALALPAGEMADRHSRKHILIACALAGMSLNAVLAAAVLLHFASIPLFFCL